MSDDQPDIEQQNVGPAAEEGGGEWPSPHEEAEEPAPGADPTEAEAIADERERDAGPGQFKEALEADPEAGGSKTTPD